jgi:hypothetical protein
MMTPNVGLGELVRELRTTLEAIGLSLIEGRADRLLDAEPRLADIAARFAALPAADIAPHRTELLAARAALRRCQRLGGTILALNEVYATRHGYGRSGHFTASDAAGVLQARV